MLEWIRLDGCVPTLCFIRIDKIVKDIRIDRIVKEIRIDKIVKDKSLRIHINIVIC